MLGDVPFTDGSALLKRLTKGFGSPVWRLMENLRPPNMVDGSLLLERIRETSLAKVGITSTSSRAKKTGHRSLGKTGQVAQHLHRFGYKQRYWL